MLRLFKKKVKASTIISKEQEEPKNGKWKILETLVWQSSKHQFN
jgi:hypothetical protein